MDQLINIEILGQPVSFKTDTNVAEAQAVADFVALSINQAATEYSKKLQSSDKRTVLILAALNIANEYFELKKKYNLLLQELGQHSEKIITTLDAPLVK